MLVIEVAPVLKDGACHNLIPAIWFGMTPYWAVPDEDTHVTRTIGCATAPTKTAARQEAASAQVGERGASGNYDRST